MIRRNDNELLMQCRKKAFKIAKKNKWIPYLYMINNIIENRCHGKPFEVNIQGYKGKPLYGIDFNIVACLSSVNEKQFTKWLEEWVEDLKNKKITYYQSITDFSL